MRLKDQKNVEGKKIMCYANQEKLEARENALHIKRSKHDSEHDPSGVLKVIEHGCSIECKSSSDGREAWRNRRKS